MKSVLEEYGIFIIEFLFGTAALTAFGIVLAKLLPVISLMFQMILGGAA